MPAAKQPGWPPSGPQLHPPFDDPDVIAGQGTIGLEILRQCSTPPDAIYVAVGGRWLIAGIAAYVKALWPQVEIVGVEPVDADAMTRSLAAGSRVRLDQVGLFADGVAVRRVGGTPSPWPNASWIGW
jgi:threonine dehydratase